MVQETDPKETRRDEVVCTVEIAASKFLALTQEAYDYMTHLYITEGLAEIGREGAQLLINIFGINRFSEAITQVLRLSSRAGAAEKITLMFESIKDVLRGRTDFDMEGFLKELSEMLVETGDVDAAGRFDLMFRKIIEALRRDEEIDIRSFLPEKVNQSLTLYDVIIALEGDRSKRLELYDRMEGDLIRGMGDQIRSDSISPEVYHQIRHHIRVYRAIDLLSANLPEAVREPVMLLVISQLHRYRGITYGMISGVDELADIADIAIELVPQVIKKYRGDLNKAIHKRVLEAEKMFIELGKARDHLLYRLSREIGRNRCRFEEILVISLLSIASDTVAIAGLSDLVIDDVKERLKREEMQISTKYFTETELLRQMRLILKRSNWHGIMHTMVFERSLFIDELRKHIS